MSICKNRLTTILLGMLALLAAACGNDIYDSLPEPLAKFVSRYYPNPEIADFTQTADVYRVVVSNGPTMIFDKQYNWLQVAGNGSALPEVFLFDQLPEVLYDYLQQTQALGKVFGVKRDDKKYTVTLLKSTVIYDIETGRLSTDQSII